MKAKEQIKESAKRLEKSKYLIERMNKLIEKIKLQNLKNKKS